MSLLLFAKSALLGIAVAAPLGPIGALCINRTLNRGFMAGGGGRIRDGVGGRVYAALAAGGFAAFASTLQLIQRPMAIGGGLFLLWLGWKFLRARPAEAEATAFGGDIFRTVSTTFALTLANPATILSFAAIFAGLGLAAQADAGSLAVVIAGVFGGSMAWWVALSGAVSIARERLPASFAIWVSRVSGMLIIAFGVFSIATAFPR